MDYGMPTLIELENLEENCALCHELGLDFVEINMNFPEFQSEFFAVEKYASLKEKYGIYFTIHLPENLDVVISKAKNSKPDCCYNHQNEVDVAKPSQKQDWHQNGNQNDNSSHRWYSGFFYPIGVNFSITLCLAYVMALHPTNEVFAEPCRYHQGKNEGKQRTERDVRPHS